MKLLLLSNSTNFGKGYLEHAMPWLREHFAAAKKLLFIPYAVDESEHEDYYEDVVTAFKALDIEIISAHHSKTPVELLEDVDGIFIGGGNTFVLLNELYKYNLIEAIANKVKAGMPYLGSSAGINMACPTIKTTNDMPIVYPPSLNALGLVNFQINPHYIDPDPLSKHKGETREMRINEFHQQNVTPVIGLREGSALKIEEDEIILLGPKSARIFRKNQGPVEIIPGMDINSVLNPEVASYTCSFFIPENNNLSPNHSMNIAPALDKF